MQVLISEARVMGLGPKFMSVYVQKLAVREPFVFISPLEIFSLMFKIYIWTNGTHC